MENVSIFLITVNSSCFRVFRYIFLKTKKNGRKKRIIKAGKNWEN